MTALNEIKTITPKLLATVAGIFVDGGTGVALAGLIASLDSVYSQKANDRFDELIQQSFDRLDMEKLDKSFLESDEFLEIFRRCIEIVTKTASDNKRKLIADYLSGVIQNATITNIHGQLLEDLNALQEFHMQVIAVLPERVDEPFPIREKVTGMLDYILDKAVSDLNRFGLVTMRFKNSSGVDVIHVTEYLIKFKETFKNINE
jgi:hypothetical protein